MALLAEVYEKLGLFYLGRHYAGPDATPPHARSEPLLYPAKDLTTHAVCVGMTGSGKTGLCLGLLEEAAIDQIPILAIDPKGDVGDLLLTFPELGACDLLPWIDPGLAEREGLSLQAVAEREAARQREGLELFGQDPGRIARLRESVEMVIYTPGSQAGRPLSLLRSFAPPAGGVSKDPELVRERVLGAVSSLLSLLGISADPLRSREHILLAQILDGAFVAGHGLTLPDLIRAVQKPSFSQVGVFELETFYPAKERLQLAMALNNILAAPGAQALAQGEPLEIASMLHTSSGKPKVAIVSIAHLSDAERMAFVTTLLSELIVWMRGQPGTSSLRALLYMDEIFGYFPPTANPPSKQPMLTLLKQARAFGLGVVLATQNPVDLDYKGLANCGTWFIGRLQTERDKLRVLDGLEGAAANSGGAFDRGEMDRLLSGLGRRVFLMNNVHEGVPRLFETRSTLCYLRGPLTRDEIRRLTQQSPAQPATSERVGETLPENAEAPSNVAHEVVRTGEPRPELPEQAHEIFFPAFNRAAGALYRPGLYARAKVHFVDRKSNVDSWRSVERWVPMAATDADPRWTLAVPVPPIASAHMASEPLAGSHFETVPHCLQQAKSYTSFRKSFAQAVYESEALVLQCAAGLDLCSLPDEAPAEFRARLELAVRERRDEAMAELQDDYRETFEKLTAKLERVRARVDRERQPSNDQALNVALAVGGGLLGAMLGHRQASPSKLGRVTKAVRSGARAARARVDLEQAEQSQELLERSLADLERGFGEDSARVAAAWRLENQVLEERRIKPRKADITVETLQFAWRPD